MKPAHPRQELCEEDRVGVGEDRWGMKRRGGDTSSLVQEPTLRVCRDHRKGVNGGTVLAVDEKVFAVVGGIQGMF